MTYRIGVVAHIKRQAMAEQLTDQVRADYVGVDDGALGAEKNHLHVWKWLTDNSDGADHLVVLEDDAVPCDDFRTQLNQALAVAPAPIVSLYLGTGHPTHWQPRIKQAVAQAEQADASWIVSTHLLHAVAVAIRTELLPPRADNHMPIDQAISNWCRRNNHHVAYAFPSLVQHADSEPVIARRYDGKPRTEPRKAWRHGLRHRWTSKVVTM